MELCDYFLNARTGQPAQSFFTADNYAGLSRTSHPVFMNQPGDAWYVQTNGVVSSWGADGSVHLHTAMFFNAVAEGCHRRQDRTRNRSLKRA